MGDTRISDIVIAGGGTAGWMAAAALARFLEQGHRITLVESEAIGTIGVGEATIPQIHLFNSWLGLDEAEFLRETKASFKLGIEFDGWSRPGSRYMHAFGFVGRAFGMAPFRHGWARASASGTARDYGAYSFNQVAARAGRFAKGDGRPGAIPDLVYAYHFDAGLYAVYLRRYAEARGVTRIEGRIETVERDPQTGDVAALLLDGGRRIAGQLFIDCSGFRGLLIGEALGTPYLDWTNYLPCDRALAVPCQRSDAFRPFTQSIAQPAGWQWRIPLQHRTGNGHVYCSSFMGEDEAATLLLDNLDGEAMDVPRPLNFTTGRRERAWDRNVVALGLSAGFMEPLESTSIHLIQAGIARLLTYFPHRKIEPTERHQFNKLTMFEWDRVRDFLIAHYKYNERVGEPFWDQCRAMPIPDSLTEKVDLFRSGGRIHREHEELFTEEGWAQLFIGQGVAPQDWHPLADLIPAEELDAFLKSLSQSYERKAASLPTHAQSVDRMAATRELA